MNAELRVTNTSRKFYTGSVWATNRFGNIKVLGQLKNQKSKYLVEFDDGSLVSVYGCSIGNGGIKNPNHPNVCGVGFIGQGSAVCWDKGKDTREYQAWHQMLRRCYSLDYQKLYPTYIGCSVNSRWHNFQNFWNDIESLSGYELWKKNDIEMHLDKDIIFPGNKIYSRENCKFVTALENYSDANKRNVVTGKTYRATRISDGYFEDFTNMADFGRKYDMHRSNICSCVKDKSKTSKGWAFEAIKEN